MRTMSDLCVIDQY